jgi:hypothetical protein
VSVDDGRCICVWCCWLMDHQVRPPPYRAQLLYAAHCAPRRAPRARAERWCWP